MSNTTLEKYILAVLTTNPNRVTGGVPIFVFQSKEEIQEKISMFESILGGMGHQLDHEIYLVVRH